MRSSTGAATRAVRSDIDKKPANSAAIASERPRASGRARQNHASAAKSAVISAGSHRTGSRSAARLSATPPIAATGIHKKKRRCSTSRASAAENALRQSGAHAAARVQPAAAARAPVRAGVAIWGQTNASLTLGKGADLARRPRNALRWTERLDGPTAAMLRPGLSARTWIRPHVMMAARPAGRLRQGRA